MTRAICTALLLLAACGDGTLTPPVNVSVVVLAPETQRVPEPEVVYQVRASDDIFTQPLVPEGDCVRRNARGGVVLREGCTVGTATFPPFEAGECNGPVRWLDVDFTIEVPQGPSYALVHARAGAGIDDPPRALAVRVGEASTNLTVRQRIASNLRYLQLLVDLHGEPDGIQVRSISATYDCKF